MRNKYKSTLGLIVLVLSGVMLAGCQQPENNMSESTFDVSSDVESASYLIGFRQAQNIQQQGVCLPSLHPFRASCKCGQRSFCGGQKC